MIAKAGRVDDRAEAGERRLVSKLDVADARAPPCPVVRRGLAEVGTNSRYRPLPPTVPNTDERPFVVSVKV
jgi:hypothetical protein